MSLVAACLLAILINTVFFKKIEFVQSKVYPNLYLVKNPIKNKDSLSEIIKTMVVQKMNDQFLGNQEKFKLRNSERSIPVLDYSIRFYEYYNGWGSNPFGEAGTAHFINNEEDPGGFSSELLANYQTYQIASFDLKYCINDTVNYVGNLSHFTNGSVVKIDPIINLCR